MALLGVTVTAFAGPPLGCIENQAKQVWCESSGKSFQRVAPRPDPWTAPKQHPATLRHPDPPDPVGQRVKSIPVHELLPDYGPVRRFVAEDAEPVVHVLKYSPPVAVSSASKKSTP